jgi:membrane protein DedA with SNARE-associated domain
VIGSLLLGVPSGIGYPLLFGFVFAESAGALVPGETALIVAAALAGNGKLSLSIVIALAALGAVLGDNLGYVIGRTALRRLLGRSGAMRSRRVRAIQRSEAFFNRHARAAVFFGRWLPGLRVVAAWLAGTNAMPWRRFLLWNTLGGISWAATVGAAAFFIGRSATGALGLIGFAGLGTAGIIALVRKLRTRGAAIAPARSIQPTSHVRVGVGLRFARSRAPTQWGRRWLPSCRGA